VWFNNGDGTAVLLNKGRSEKPKPAVRIRPGEVVRVFKRLEAGVPRIGQFVRVTLPTQRDHHGCEFPRPDSVAYWEERYAWEVVGYCRSEFDTKPLRKSPITLDHVILRRTYWSRPGIPIVEEINLPIEQCSVVSARPVRERPEELPVVCGGWFNVPPARFYVFCHDTFMSGWGEAVHRDLGTGREVPLEAWCIFPCDSVVEARDVLRNVRRRPEMGRVHVCRFLGHSGGHKSQRDYWDHDRHSRYERKKRDPKKRWTQKNTYLDFSKHLVGNEPFLLYPGVSTHVNIMHKSRCPNWYSPDTGGKVVAPHATVEEAREGMASLIDMIGQYGGD
jgi:hypothetical protein